MIITIAGGSGFVGQHLIQSLISQHEVVVLCRDTHDAVNKLKNSKFNLKPFLYSKIFVISYKEAQEAYSYLYGTSKDLGDDINLYIIKIHDNKNKIDISSIFNKLIASDVVINLAGENVGERFIHKKRIEELLKSRLYVVDEIAKIFFKKETKKDGRLFIQASATGYYAQESHNELDESSSVGDTFLSDICQQLEKRAIHYFGKENTCILRFSIVISKHGGFFAILKSMPAIYLISGRYIPYIYIDDVCKSVSYIMQNRLTGIFNMCTPEYDKTHNLLKVLNYRRHLQIPVFPFMINLFDKRGLLLTANQKVLPKALIDSGYEFEVKNIKDLLNKIKKKK